MDRRQDGVRLQPRAVRHLLSCAPKDLVRTAYGHLQDAAKDSPAVIKKLRQNLDILLARTDDPALRAALDEQRRAL